MTPRVPENERPYIELSKYYKLKDLKQKAEITFSYIGTNTLKGVKNPVNEAESYLLRAFYSPQSDHLFRLVLFQALLKFLNLLKKSSTSLS